MATLATLRDRVRQRSDMEQKEGFISDSELNQYISDSYAELYDLLVSRFEDYYVADPLEFSISSGSTYALPSDFYKILGLDRALSGTEYYTVRPFVFEDRNRRRIADRLRGVYPQVRYRIVGDNIRISPEDQATGDYRLWYVPSHTALSSDSDTVDSIVTRNGWEEYIIVDASIKCLQKEESDVSVLFAQKQDLIKRIEEMAQNRDAGETDRITDVTMSGYDDPYFFG